MSDPRPINDVLTFAEPEPGTVGRPGDPWKVLVADDDEDVHRVTQMALSDFSFLNRPLRFLGATTGRQAVEIMRSEPDVALVLMDVVMETEHAGLDAVEAIRKDLHNSMVRIILRTGQPGQAPEREVVSKFDINDYKEKTELTTKKLYTVVHTGLAHYRELAAMESNRTGLHKVIEASANIFQKQSLEQFAEGVLQQLAALLYARPGAVMVHSTGLAASRRPDEGLRVIAGTGSYANCAGKLANRAVGPEVLAQLEQALRDKRSSYGERSFTGYFATRAGNENVLYVSSDAPIGMADRGLVELLCRNVSIAFENLHLKEEMESNQREMVVTLSEAIESRSLETGNHVRRVAEYSKLLARLAGLSESDTQMIFLASPLHDAGKISIPDGVLNKPGRHNAAEALLMRTHAEAGHKIFENRDLPVLRAAAIVAGEHHERWDGKGYPNRRKGEEIHIFGRITALADVFDALCSRRCYKEPWTLEKVVDHIRGERGGHFDPELVDLFMENLDRFLMIKEQLTDPDEAPVVH